MNTGVKEIKIINKEQVDLSKEEMIEEIKRLKKERNAVILAHYYQRGEIQDIADFVGDSLDLSIKAANTEAEVIMFCGVHFMAETAKILSPQKTVLLSNSNAGCNMADMVEEEGLQALKEKYPGVPVVVYVNSSAGVKAIADVSCTSANAVKVVQSLKSKQVIFAPDQNLANHVQKFVPDTEMIPWEGYCIIHHRVKEEEILKVKETKPGIKVLVHPECSPNLVQHADFIGSTSQIIKYANESTDQEFVIGTEMGVFHKLQKDNPDKKFYLLSPGLVCSHMKKTSLEDLYLGLRDLRNQVQVPAEIIEKASKSLHRMLSI